MSQIESVADILEDVQATSAAASSLTAFDASELDPVIARKLHQRYLDVNKNRFIRAVPELV